MHALFLFVCLFVYFLSTFIYCSFIQWFCFFILSSDSSWMVGFRVGIIDWLLGFPNEKNFPVTRLKVTSNISVSKRFVSTAIDSPLVLNQAIIFFLTLSSTRPLLLLTVNKQKSKQLYYQHCSMSAQYRCGAKYRFI